jgi:hypothetical protein
MVQGTGDVVAHNRRQRANSVAEKPDNESVRGYPTLGEGSETRFGRDKPPFRPLPTARELSEPQVVEIRPTFRGFPKGRELSEPRVVEIKRRAV